MKYIPPNSLMYRTGPNANHHANNIKTRKFRSDRVVLCSGINPFFKYESKIEYILFYCISTLEYTIDA